MAREYVCPEHLPTRNELIYCQIPLLIEWITICTRGIAHLVAIPTQDL